MAKKVNALHEELFSGCVLTILFNCCIRIVVHHVPFVWAVAGGGERCVWTCHTGNISPYFLCCALPQY